jgi:hypothetical protein
MAEKIDQTIRKAIQDTLAPDFRELRAQLISLQTQTNQVFDTFDKRFDALSDKSDTHFKALMAALGQASESKPTD